jgi:hypothetical protein
VGVPCAALARERDPLAATGGATIERAARQVEQRFARGLRPYVEVADLLRFSKLVALRSEARRSAAQRMG